jgi:hypothetical protein
MTYLSKMLQKAMMIKKPSRCIGRVFVLYKNDLNKLF